MDVNFTWSSGPVAPELTKPGPFGSTGTVLLLLVTLASFVTARSMSSKARLRLPPGPNRLPLIGNAHQIDNKHPVSQFKEWAEQYGVTDPLSIFGQNVIVLNTDRVAKDLLDTKGSIYSSRKPPYFAYNLMSKACRMVFHPYGEEWRKARKIMHRLLAPTSWGTAGNTQELESRQLLHELLVGSTDSHFFTSLKRFASSSIMTLCYGHRFPTNNDPCISAIFEAMDTLSLVSQPGAYLVDSIPALRKLPEAMQPWQREAQDLHMHEWKTWGSLLERCKEEIESGNARTCFITDLLREAGSLETDEERKKAQLTDLDIAYAACALLEAGSDTTASTVASACLAMLLHPDIQARAQAELDIVVGDKRLPQYEDEEKLPLVRAIIKETLRWRPPTVMGVPHAVIQDDTYKGYHIPKDSMVIDNIYAMSHDPSRFPNPEKFDPVGRFYLSHPATAAEYAGKRDCGERDHFAYGHGRRICQGIHMAEKSLFQAVTRILWAFHIEPALDPVTKTTVPVQSDPHHETYTDGFVSFPKPFVASFQPRSPQHAALIKREFEDAKSTWLATALET